MDELQISREVVLDAREFPASFTVAEIWASEDRAVVVETVAVHHEPVPDAVAYRIITPDGFVVISGDTRVCQEVENQSQCKRSCSRSISPRPAGTLYGDLSAHQINS